jgi:hypothetical protein
MIADVLALTSPSRSSGLADCGAVGETRVCVTKPISKTEKSIMNKKIAAIVCAASGMLRIVALMTTFVVIISAQVSDFTAVSLDLQMMHDLFRGGNGQPVTFDAAAAAQRGFSRESILIAEQIASFTNDLIRQHDQNEKRIVNELRSAVAESRTQFAADGDSGTNALDESKYPDLERYFVAANINRRGLSTMSPTEQERAAATFFKERSARQSSTAGGSKAAWYDDPYTVCGSFAVPQPWGAAAKQTFTSNDPAATLRSWGYHLDPMGNASWLASSDRIGWTRPQTYKWWLCGWGTFRDNADITGQNQFWEQNYEWFTPRGEPNPEFWRSGPWPYPSWPTYVYWWHRTR